MGVYIKGMEMPKGCAFCRIGKRNGKKMVCPLCDEEWDIHDPMSADHRLDNCPLLPVPPHGDLIERKAAYGSLLNCMAMTGYQSRALSCIDEFCVPTIIPADPAEEGET